MSRRLRVLYTKDKKIKMMGLMPVNLTRDKHLLVDLNKPVSGKTLASELQATKLYHKANTKVGVYFS